MPGLVVKWKATPLEHGRSWDALCMVVDVDRSWLEWFTLEELRPARSDVPGA